MTTPPSDRDRYTLRRKTAGKLGLVLVPILLSQVLLSILPAAAAVTFTVTAADDVDDGTCDAGHCSLREAIIAANADTEADTIEFGIPGVGPHVLAPATDLPLVTQPVTINGYTQPGSLPATVSDPATIQIFIQGTAALTNGLEITGGASTVRGLAIGGFSNGVSGAAIEISGGGGNVIAGNHLGLDATGAAAAPNGRGIRVLSADNTIGGAVAADRNVISGNTDHGVLIESVSGTVVEGNYIGTDADGTGALANGFAGIDLLGQNSTISNNVVSGNTDRGIGVFRSGARPTNNLISDNLIGVAPDLSPLGNAGEGVQIGAGLAADVELTTVRDNVISSNGDNGILILASPARDTLIEGNIIGQPSVGAGPTGNGLNGILIQANGPHVIGGTTPAARNVISGNGASGIRLQAGAALNVIQGNYIGVDETGTSSLGNAADGITIGVTGFTAEPSGNTVGGTAAGAGNLIGGNLGHGINIAGDARTTTVQGNLVGLNAGGADLGNGGHGIRMIGETSFSAGANVIGGAAAGAGNTVAFNSGAGVTVEGMSIGNDISRNSIHSNGGLGIDIGADGVTPNNPGGSHDGPNRLQEFPVVASATSGSTTVSGSLEASADTDFRLEFFASPSCDASGSGEGRDFIGTASVTTDGSGDAAFSETFVTTVPVGDQITATATAIYFSESDTSEFSVCAPVAAGGGGPVVQQLTVTAAGSGTVTSAPAGIACGADCLEDYPTGTAVTLTATPDPGQSFLGWSGDCAGVAPTCALTMNGIRSVGATFSSTSGGGGGGSVLEVTREGDGEGSVVSDPEGIACGDECRATFQAGEVVTLVATPDDGSEFIGWGGDCLGTGGCALEMGSDRSVVATFAAAELTEVSLKFRRRAFRGLLTSTEPGCVSDRRVVIKKRGHGSIGRAVTDAQGRYALPQSRPQGRFTARVRPDDNGQIECHAATSQVLRRIPRKLSIRYRKGAFSGWATSKYPECVPDREVVIKTLRKRETVVIGRVKTNLKGRYVFPWEKTHGWFFARMPRVDLGDVQCRRAVSDPLVIRRRDV